MKTSLTIVLMALFIQVSAQNKTSIVFIDNSASTVLDEALKERKRKQLLNTLWGQIQNNGDRVILSFIYEASGSISNKKEYVFQTPSLNTDKLTPQRAKIAEQNYRKLIQDKRKSFVINVVNDALAFKENRPMTHILDVLPLLSHFTQEFGALNIYFFSDMIEDSPHRNLLKTNISTVEQSEGFGREDAKKIVKAFNIKSDFLKDNQVQVYLAVPAMESRPVFKWLPSYWNGVFTSMGLQSENLKFNSL
tara:strand:- start:1169 stop:1915 length:747 start_codon:yes stop_codon:yes gene_type:complete